MRLKNSIDELIEKNFLRKVVKKKTRKKFYTVKTPFKIRFSQEAVKKLNNRYDSTLEKGGVLITFPKLVGVTLFFT